MSVLGCKADNLHLSTSKATYMPRGAVLLFLSVGFIIQHCQFLVQCLEDITLLFCDDQRTIPWKTVYVFCRFHSVYRHYLMYFLQSSGHCEK